MRSGGVESLCCRVGDHLGGMGRLEGWAACGGWAVLQAPLPRLLNEIGLFRNREGGDFALRVRGGLVTRPQEVKMGWSQGHKASGCV